MATYILGIDLGTTSVKACLLDTRTKTVAASYSKATLAGEGSEQDVSKIISAAQHCVGRISRDLLKQVVRISVCGQMHGVVFWKNRDSWHIVEHSESHRFETNASEISPLFTWQDSRCTPDFLAQIPKPDSHLPVCSGYGCATIFWMKENNPETLNDFHKAGTIQDLFVAMLCGLDNPVMSVQNAASWGYYNTEKKSWNVELLTESGFPAKILPEVVEPGAVAGRLVIPWYGIPAGVEVLAALGDMQCSVLSTLHSQEIPSAVVNISTSAQLSFIMPSHFNLSSELPTIQYFPYFRNRYLAVAASLNGGNVLAAFVRMLQNWVHELGLNVPQDHIWDRLMNPPASTEKDSTEDMILTPTLFGERHNPDSAFASVTNITRQNLGLDQVMKALCKGLVTNLHTMFPAEVLKAFGAKQLLGTGSALSRNVILREALAEQYEEIPFEIIETGDAALGAAIAGLDAS